MCKTQGCFQHRRSFFCVVPGPLLSSQSCIFICPGTHASFTIFSGPGPFLLNYADNGSPLVSRPAVGAYGLLWELQTGTATPFTICALNYTHSGTLLYHLLLDLSLMSDCQSQSLSSSVHLSEPLSILWTLGGWPSGCKLFTSPHALPALLRLPFWSCFLSAPLSIWWHEVFRATQTAWTQAQYRTDIWALLAAKTVSSLHGPWYWGHISKDWWATWVWRSYFEMLSERGEKQSCGVELCSLAQLNKKDERSHVFVFASSKLSFLLFADDILNVPQFTSTPCHPGRLKQMMKIDDVMVCKSAKPDHLNHALAHYIIRNIDLLFDHATNNLITLSLLLCTGPSQ